MITKGYHLIHTKQHFVQLAWQQNCELSKTIANKLSPISIRAKVFLTLR